MISTYWFKIYLSINLKFTLIARHIRNMATCVWLSKDCTLFVLYHFCQQMLSQKQITIVEGVKQANETLVDFLPYLFPAVKIDWC